MNIFSRRLYGMRQTVIAILCLFPAHSSQGVDPLVMTGVVAAAGGLVIGAGMTHWYHTSSSHQEHEAQKEAIVLKAAEESLVNMRSRRHLFLQQQTSYALLSAHLSNGSGEVEIQNLSQHINAYKEYAREHLARLQTITGSYGEMSKKHAKQAQELSAQFTEFLEEYRMHGAVIQEIEHRRFAPLRDLKVIAPGMELLGSYQHDQDDKKASHLSLLSYIEGAYQTVPTKHGSCGVPLVSANEALHQQEQQLAILATRLHLHVSSIVQREPDVDAALQKLETWGRWTRMAREAIGQSPLFVQQMEKDELRYKIILEEKRRAEDAQAQKYREKERLERAKADVERAVADRTHEENERKRLQLATINAAANVVHAAAVTAAVLTAPTYHTCPMHHCDYYECAEHCHHRRDYIIKVYRVH